MPRRISIPNDELVRRAVAYVDRRGGALIRRGGRSGGGSWGKKRFGVGELYGLSQFSLANLYQTAVGGGEAGVSSGFGTVEMFVLDALGGATQHLFDNCGATVVDGWSSFIQSNALRFGCASSAPALVSSPGYSLLASDLSQVLVAVGWHDGVKVRLMTSRTEQLDGTAITGYTPPTAARANALGGLVGAAPASNCKPIGSLTFRGVPSRTQLEALFDAIRMLGDVPQTFPLGSATDADIAALAPRHWYDADTYTPNAGNLGALTNRNLAVGGQLTVGGGTVPLPAADAALNGQKSIVLNGTQWLDASLSAAEFQFMHDGTSGEAFHVFVPTTLNGAHSLTATGREAAAKPGWNAYLASTGGARLTITNAAGANHAVDLPAASFAVGRAGVLHCLYSNAPSEAAIGASDLNVVQTPTLAPSAAPPPSTLRVGAWSDGSIQFYGRIAAIFIFNRRLSARERQTVRDYIRVRYGIGQITTTHRWSLRDELAKAAVPVIDGQLAPASLPDTVTGAAVDAMARQGSPVVRVIDATVDGRKSYGFLGVSTANYLSTISTAGIGGSATTGLHVRMLWRPESLTTTRVMVGRGVVSGAGWWIQISGSGLAGVIGNAATATYTIQTAELNLWHVVEIVLSGSAIRLYWDGVKVGADASTYFPGPHPGPMLWGWSGVGGTNPGDRESYSGLAGGDFPTTDAEVLAAYQETMRTGKVAATAGKTQHLYDPTADIIANGGPAAGFPGQVQDRIGTDHLTRVGGIAVMASPATGVRNFDGGHAYAGNALLGSATFWASCMVVQEDLAGIKVPFGRSDHSTGGWYFYLANTILTARAFPAAGGTAIEAPYTTIPAGRIGTLVHCAMRISGGFLQLFFDGAPIGTPIAIVGFKPSPTMLAIGGTNNGNTYAAKNLGFVGGGGGDFAPSDAEILTHAQACLSAGVWQPIAAKTDVSIQISADVADAGGAVPVMLKNRQTGATVATKLGAPLQVASRTERLWSYETQPIMYGAA